MGSAGNFLQTMMNQQLCPFCKTPAITGCDHLAMVAQGREFVKRCIERCQAEKQWHTLCESRHRQGVASGEWSPERDDFTWLETAFCDEFLKPLRWFGGMEYEWRSGRKPADAGFWVLLWSKDPQRLWWELQDQIERQAREGRPRSTSPAVEFPHPRAHSGTQPSLRF